MLVLVRVILHKVTNARAEQIKKHYASQMRKSVSGNRSLTVPKTITCNTMKLHWFLLGSCLWRSFCNNAQDLYEVRRRKSSRDLACQSAERWSCLENDAGLHNFELHAFRSAFQMVLSVYYPEVMITSPSIGRQGKALRRRQRRGIPESSVNQEESTCSSFPQITSNTKGSCSHLKPKKIETDDSFETELETTAIGNEHSSGKATKCEGTPLIDKYPLFEKYCLSGLCRLGLEPLKDTDLHGIWKEVEPFSELIGPYWSLRAAFGPPLETLLLLDRLLFLQEQGSSVEVVMLPIFDPALSPRNVAIIAKKLTQI
ncbi:hypothetical protein M0R45_014360 [Rubus argutus]|uniref:Uncharacterized protein n=1 Tax=Rubus argutus TaxID=59490 RepID=A0AAW1XMH9_RUBAR